MPENDQQPELPTLDGTELAGKRVAFLVANEGVEQVELTAPWSAVREAGAPRADRPPVRAGPSLQPPGQGRPLPRRPHDSRPGPSEFDALVLPGGVANPDQLRLDRSAVEIVRHFFDAGKPVAVICHGPWTLVEADVVRGRTLTSWPSLRTDILNAGGTWVDQQVVEDDGLVTSRRPDDLPPFCEAMVRTIRRGRPAHRAKAA